MTKHTPHNFTTRRLSTLLRNHLGGDWIISEEKSVELGKTWRPEPDIAVVRGPDDRYRLHDPTDDDIALIVEVADSKLANDIYCLTINPQGQVVVSGRGYIRVLLGGPGKAGRTLDFADAPRDGAMGLFWEKDDLYCVGDGGLAVSERLAGEVLSLPMHAYLDERTQDRIVAAVCHALDG